MPSGRLTGALSGQVANALHQVLEAATAQAAELLGYSRPYVAMLIDQNKLTGVTVSAGGHRRVSRAGICACIATEFRKGYKIVV
jgi:excisionase family DNA binding protein